MAGEIEIAKTNLYVSHGKLVAGGIAAAKSNFYISTLQTDNKVFLAKTNFYIADDPHPESEVRLAKTNLYVVTGLGSLNQFVTFPKFGNVNSLPFNEVVLDGTTDGDIGKFSIREMERNPYRAHLGDKSDSMIEDFKEQQRILRQQHNITQAGDTTFDYGLLLKVYPTREFTLGSLGRFFHDEYGLIQARFCQFVDWKDSIWQGQPVGRRIYNTTEVDWIVTNDLDKSGADLILGFTFFAEPVLDAYYGWVVVSGANPASIRVTTAEIPAQNEAYTWTESGGIGIKESGTIAARRWAKTSRHNVPAGSIFIGVEGRSDKSQELTIREWLDTELTTVFETSSKVSALEEQNRFVTTRLFELAASDSELLRLIKQEELIRGREIQAIRNSTQIIDIDTKILETAVILRAEFAAADGAIQVRAEQAFQLATAVQAQLTALDLSALAGLEGIADSLASITSRFGKITLFDTDTTPIVDGQTFVSTHTVNPDGNDVWVMQPKDFKLQALLDVDWIPPAGLKESPMWNGVDAFVFKEMAWASNVIGASSPLAITIGGAVGDPLTQIVHEYSGVTAGTYGSKLKIPKPTVTIFGHVTNVVEQGTAYPIPFGFTSAPLADEIMLLHSFPHAVTLPANFTGSTGFVGGSPSATYTFTVYKGTPGSFASIGTISISSSGIVTFSSSGIVTFAVGDSLKVQGQTAVETGLINCAFTFDGERL